MTPIPLFLLYGTIYHGIIFSHKDMEGKEVSVIFIYLPIHNLLFLQNQVTA